MSDIYLSLTETPSVVTLSQPVVSGVLNSTVTVANVVSVNVVTMPAITVQAAAPAVTTVAGSVAVSNFPATQVVSVSNLPASQVVSVSNFPASSSVTIANFPAAQVVTGTVALDAASLAALESVTVTVGNVTIGSSVSVSNFPATQTIAGTVTANGGNFLNSQNALITNDSANNLVLLGGLSYSSTPTQSAIDALRTDGNGQIRVYQQQTFWTDTNQGNQARAASQQTPFPVQVLGGSVTIGSLPAISGTVTATLADQLYDSGTPVFVAAYLNSSGGDVIPVSQDANAGMPISGTVAVGAMPSGALTTRFGTPTTANTAFATSAVTNASRKYLLIQNVTTGSNVITVGIGFTPTTTQGIQLTAGAGITFESSYIPTGAVYVLSSVTASNFTVLEA